MGLVLERSGMAEELLDTVGQLFGRVRGGLAFAVVLVGALLAATTGVMAATVIAMGLISLPIMLRYGYDKRLAAGVIAASGTLAQIIPPSIVLIVLADQLGASVGDMYAGALVPGLGAGRAVSVLRLRRHAVQARRRPGPAAAGTHPARRGADTARGGFPGPAADTDFSCARHHLSRHRHAHRGRRARRGRGAGAGGAAPAPDAGRDEAGHGLDRAPDLLRDFHPHRLDRVQPGVPRRRRRPLGRKPADATARRRDRLPRSGEPAGVLAGVFLDFFEIAFIVVPLLAPVAAKLGIDPIWFGVLLGINMQTSFLHPPFGFALFYLRSVAPKSIATSDIYWGAVPFVLLQVLMVAIVITFPQIVGHAPIVPESTIMEVPLQVDPDAGFLPPEWR